jgi:hypothetical protein
VKRAPIAAIFTALAFGAFVVPQPQAQTLPVLAIGTLDQSRAGSFVDLSGLTYNLENGVRANELGGFGSAIAYASGETFLALPDRGPNAVEFDDTIDTTASYVNRFHTVKMHLVPNTTGAGLPFTLTPELQSITLLWSLTPLVYGSGAGLGVGSGVPPTCASPTTALASTPPTSTALTSMSLTAHRPAPPLVRLASILFRDQSQPGR